MAGPAAEVTRERPWVALLETSDAVDEAWEVACLAASAAFVVLVDSKRTMRRPMERPDRLMTREKDIVIVVVMERIRKKLRVSADGAEIWGIRGLRPKRNWAGVDGRRWLRRRETISRKPGTRMGPEIEKNWKAREISKGVWLTARFSARRRPIRGVNWELAKSPDGSELPC